MFKELAVKAFSFYTAPMRFAFSGSADLLDRINAIKTDLLIAVEDFQDIKHEMGIVADEVYSQVAADLSRLPDDLTPEEVELAVAQSMSKAKALLTEAFMELSKGKVLPSSGSQQPDVRSNAHHNIIEGEIVG